MSSQFPPDPPPARSNKSKPAVGDKQDKGSDVQAMFASIAPNYDLLNRVLSMGIDRIWRQKATNKALAKSPQRILDVATGTADFALQLKKQAPQAEVVGSDFVPAMLEIGRKKAQQQRLDIRLEEGDALNLPYPDASFDTITCAFGFRNFSDYTAGLCELWRVLDKGGRLVILEFPPPQQGIFGTVFRFYFQRILPRIGGLISGNAAAYTYLPESVLAFPEPEQLVQVMHATGFKSHYQPLTLGIAGIWVGDKHK